MIECGAAARATSSAGNPARCACAAPPPACSTPSASSGASSDTATLPRALAVERETARARTDANAHTPSMPTEEAATLATI
jgi:hypothetical protein